MLHQAGGELLLSESSSNSEEVPLPYDWHLLWTSSRGHPSQFPPPGQQRLRTPRASSETLMGGEGKADKLSLSGFNQYLSTDGFSNPRAKKTPSCLLTKNFLLPPLFWCKKLQKAGRNNKLHGVPVFSSHRACNPFKALQAPCAPPAGRALGMVATGWAWLWKPQEKECTLDICHAGHVPDLHRAFPRISPRGTEAGSVGSGE